MHILRNLIFLNICYLTNYRVQQNPADKDLVLGIYIFNHASSLLKENNNVYYLFFNINLESLAIASIIQIYSLR